MGTDRRQEMAQDGGEGIRISIPVSGTSPSAAMISLAGMPTMRLPERRTCAVPEKMRAERPAVAHPGIEAET